MKKIRLGWLLLVLIGALIFSACSPSQTNDEDVVTITDLTGREVSVPAAVDSVVAIGPGALRLVVYAGGAPYVVGVEQFEQNSAIGRPYWLANPSLAELPAIGQGGPNNAPDPEKLLSVNPDVIFSTYATDAATADELQEKTGIPVVALSYGTVGFGITAIFGEPIQDSLALVGQVLGIEETAQAAVDFILGSQADLEARTASAAEGEQTTVYVGGLGSKGTHGIESTQGQYALLNVIHAVNVADAVGQAGSVMVDKEALLEWDPDVIVIDEGGLATVLEDVAKNPVFYQALSAVENGQVYGQLPYNYYSTNLDTAIANAYYLGTILYPEAFADVDPVAKADEIYTAMVGIPVYDQMAADFGGYGPITFDLPE